MQDTSFWVSPIRENAFFEQTVLERQVGHAFLQGAGLPAQIMHLTGGRGTGSIARQAALAGFHELRIPTMPPTYSDLIAPTIPS